MVVAESVMVDQLTFGGGGKMHGGFVDSLTGNTRGFAAVYGRRESREATLAKGWHNLERVGSKLHMSNSLIEAAKRLYHLALQRSFTSGRNNYYVVSACLYAVARREKAPHMLLDFSDALLTPVRTLAQVFVKLVRSLSLQVPSIDPSLFMDRFAKEMNLGPDTNKVAHTGVRLVQAMSREWLVTGRRPLGLCAASLLIAARYHGRKINADDINGLFRVSSATVQKRLSEFRDTSTAAVLVRDFEETDLLTLPIASLPPCVTAAARRKRKFLALENPLLEEEEEDQTPQATPQMLAIADQSEAALSQRLAVSVVPPGASQAIQIEGVNPDALCDESASVGDVANIATRMCKALQNAAEEGGEDVVSRVGKEAAQIISFIETAIPDTAAHLTVGKRDDRLALALASTEDAEGEEDEELEETLSDVDEAAVDAMLLDEGEKVAKTLIWDELTKDIMGLVHERLAERKLRQANAALKSTKRLKRPPLPPMSSPQDSVKAALQRTSQGLANRMNPDALTELFT